VKKGKNVQAILFMVEGRELFKELLGILSGGYGIVDIPWVFRIREGNSTSHFIKADL